MIKTSLGFTDTATSSPKPVQLTVPELNYDEDFAIKSTLSANGKAEVKLLNQTSPLGQCELVRYGVSEIADIYKGTGISQDHIGDSTKGVKLLAQITETLKVTDDASPTFVVESPFSVQLVLTGPSNQYATDALYVSLIARLIGTLYEHGVPKILTKMKGALTPKEL